MDIGDAYRTANQWRDGELSRLFQRVNYFLIGTAFLIAPLVALFLSQSFVGSLGLILFAYLLIVTGIFLSVLFTVSNYLNDVIIRRIIRYIQALEQGTNNDPAFVSWLFNDITRGNLDFSPFVKVFWGDLWDAIRHPAVATNPNDPRRGRTAALTWLIPFYFVIFWSIVGIGLIIVLCVAK